MQKKTKKSILKPKMPDLPVGWFYMSEKTAEPDMLAAALEGCGYDIEVWNEAGVIEIGVGEKASVDLERIETDLGDPFSNAFVEEHHIQTIYYLSVTRD